MTNNTPTPRPEAVDIDQFEGLIMEPTEVWPHTTEKRLIVRDLHGYFCEFNLPTSTWEKDAELVASLPDLIADLRATRSERDRAAKILEQTLPLIERTIDATPTGDKRNEICDLNIEARALLAELEGTG